MKKNVKDPYIRLKFKDSGIDLAVRYNIINDKRNIIPTAIKREISNRIRETDDVEITYLHT